MSETRAVPSTLLAAANRDSVAGGLPLCPACLTGYLQPFRVTIGVREPGQPAGFGGADYIEGWVAVCQGNSAAAAGLDRLRVEAGVAFEATPVCQPCGFTMQMSAARWNEPGKIKISG